MIGEGRGKRSIKAGVTSHQICCVFNGIYDLEIEPVGHLIDFLQKF